MNGYVPGEQPQVGKFIKLNTNENPYPASPAVARAVQAVLERGLGRYPDPLASAFRRRAAEVLDVDPDWVLCGNGSDEILTTHHAGLRRRGAATAAPIPQLYPLQDARSDSRCAGAKRSRFEPDWSLADGFASAGDGLRLVFLPNPNSPSGTMISSEHILELAERLPCPIVVDEAYADFASGNCLRLVAQNEKIMVSRSLSKSYALAGLRFGFLVAQPQVIAGLIKVKDSYNCDALSIAAATAAIDDQNWLALNRAKIVATRAALTTGMRELGFAAVESQANFVWCPHPQVPVKPLYERLKSHRVLVRYMDYSSWGDGLRISVGSDEQIEACLGLLKGMV